MLILSLLQNSNHKLTFDRLLHLVKQIVISDEIKNASYNMVPKMQTYLLVDNIEKPHDQVLRNYDFNETTTNVSGVNSGTSTANQVGAGHNTPRTSQYNTRHLYTNLFDWKTLNDQSSSTNGMQEPQRENHDPMEKDNENSGRRVNQEQKQAPTSEENQGS